MNANRLTDQLASCWSAQHVFLYRLTAGLGPFDRNICILTTRGRKTGREISKPLWYYEPYTKWRRPSPDDSPWYRFRRWLAVDIFGWLR